VAVDCSVTSKVITGIEVMHAVIVLPSGPVVTTDTKCWVYCDIERFRMETALPDESV
jgi:hypothetical protein